MLISVWGVMAVMQHLASMLPSDWQGTYRGLNLHMGDIRTSPERVSGGLRRRDAEIGMMIHQASIQPWLPGSVHATLQLSNLIYLIAAVPTSPSSMCDPLHNVGPLLAIIVTQTTTIFTQIKRWIPPYKEGIKILSFSTEDPIIVTNYYWKTVGQCLQQNSVISDK